MYILGLLCFLDESIPLFLLLGKKKAFHSRWVVVENYFKHLEGHHMEEALGHYQDPWLGGVLVEKYRKADLDSVWKKNFLIEPKHGVAALDSSELPVSGCHK